SSVLAAAFCLSKQRKNRESNTQGVNFLPSPCLLTSSIPRLLPTTRRLSPCSTSEAPAVSLSTASVIFSALAARTLPSPKSATSRRTLAASVRTWISCPLLPHFTD